MTLHAADALLTALSQQLAAELALPLGEAWSRIYLHELFIDDNSDVPAVTVLFKDRSRPDCIFGMYCATTPYAGSLTPEMIAFVASVCAENLREHVMAGFLNHAECAPGEISWQIGRPPA